jgi:phenylalanyl-tRNA synthetase beta chain
MPPIINSHLTGKISEKTQDVFIECSGFDYRVLSKCLNIIVTTLAEMGGEIYSLELHYPRTTYLSPDLEPEEMKINLNYINKILGLNLDEKQLQKYLEAMGYGYQDKKALVPAYRADILHPVDLVEDIAIAYGYENFEPEIPQVATIGQEDLFEKFLDKVRNILVGFKLQEIKSYHLMTKEELNQKMDLDYPPIPLRNSLGDYNHLRNWLIPSGLKVLSENQHHDYPQNIFEIGSVFLKDEKQETNVKEYQRVSVLLCHEKTDFTEVKQIMDAFFGALDVDYKIEETEHPSFIEGRVGRVSVKNKKLAYTGELSPGVLINWGLTMPVTALEINLTELFELIK